MSEEMAANALRGLAARALSAALLRVRAVASDLDPATRSSSASKTPNRGRLQAVLGARDQLQGLLRAVVAIGESLDLPSTRARHDRRGPPAASSASLSGYAMRYSATCTSRTSGVPRSSPRTTRRC